MSEPLYDPERGWKSLQPFIDAQDDPVVKALVQQVQDHMRTEVRGELEPLMTTLSKDAKYHMWGQAEENGPKSRESVNKFYSDMFDMNANGFEFDVRRVFADRGGVVTEGRLRTLMPGSMAAAAGVTEVDGEPLDPDAMYVNEGQLLTVWPAAESGTLLGEDIYFGSPGVSLTKVPA